MSDPGVHTDKPVLTLIQQIKDGSVHSSTLTKEQRQQCVEVLLLEGYSVPQIAQILDRSEKTIKRDCADIRMRNALNPSPDLARQLIGHFFMKWEAHQVSLARLARSKEGSVAERAQAERHAWDVLKGGIELLQSLGYLPQRPQQIRGELMHHFGTEDEDHVLEVAEQTISEVLVIAQETGGLSPEVAKELPSLQRRLGEAKLKQEAQHLLNQQKKADDGREETNGE